jgi:hypothetical protein
MNMKQSNYCIFNLGGVLVNFQPKEYLSSLGYSMQTAQELATTVFQNEIFHKVDRGEMSFFQGVSEYVRENAGSKLAEDVSKILTPGWFSVLTENNELTLFLKSLYDNKDHLYIAAVFSKDGLAYMKEKFDFFKLFDDTVLSCEAGTNSPEALYRILMERNGLEPAKLVLVDRDPSHLDIAQKMGMRTIHYTNVEELKSQL